METQRILMRSLAVVFIASVIWTITGAEPQKPGECCTKVSTANFTDPIIGLRTQNESLPCVRAMILETERGNFCCDPSNPWVRKKVIQFIRTQRNKRLTSTAPPTSSTPEITRVGESTQSTDSSRITNNLKVTHNENTMSV